MAKRVDELRLSVEAFLAWDDRTDTRYELDEGLVVAMSPPSLAHATIAQTIGEIINERVRDRPPCRALQGAGVLVSRAESRFYIPDVLLTCEEPTSRTYAEAPRLIVEILSPTTTGLDQHAKVPHYAALPTVEEIWLVDSTRRAVLVWRRTSAGWLAEIPYTGAQSFPSPALGGAVALERVYRLTGV